MLKQNSISYSFFTMLHPVSLSCGHSGCKDCIEELVKIRGPRSRCPVCLQYFDGKSVKQNFTLQQITRALPVKCCNGDCGWEGIYENAATHYGQCPKLEIECPNDGCFRTESEKAWTRTLLCVQNERYHVRNAKGKCYGKHYRTTRQWTVSTQSWNVR